MKIYLCENCGNCRNATKWLEQQKIAYEKVDLKSQPPKRKELERMLEIQDGKVRRLFNTAGLEYRRMNLKEKLPKMSKSEALDLLSKNGMLVKRPFVLTEDSGAVGFKLFEWKKLFP